MWAGAKSAGNAFKSHSFLEIPRCSTQVAVLKCYLMFFPLWPLPVTSLPTYIFALINFIGVYCYSWCYRSRLFHQQLLEYYLYHQQSFFLLRVVESRVRVTCTVRSWTHPAKMDNGSLSDGHVEILRSPVRDIINRLCLKICWTCSQNKISLEWR